MPQNEPIRESGPVFDFLEPAMDPNSARTKHGLIVPASTGTYVTYVKGQTVREKTDGSNLFAKDGVAGYTGPAHLVKYTFTINDAGQFQYGNTFYVGVSEQTFEGSMDLYYQGKFRCADITADVLDESIGRLIQGAYNNAQGILDLGVGTPVTPA